MAAAGTGGLGGVQGTEDIISTSLPPRWLCVQQVTSLLQVAGMFVRYA